MVTPPGWRRRLLRRQGWTACIGLEWWAFVSSGGDVQDYESTWVMQFTAGYQFQSPNGFWVRPTFTLNMANAGSGSDMLLWPGIAMGGSF